MSRHLVLVLAIGACTGSPARPFATVAGPDPIESVAPAIRIELDRPYADSDDSSRRLDLYVPVHDRRALPVIVFFPDGRMHGSKADGVARLMPFLRTRRYAVVSVDYRTTEQAPWPAQLEDAKAAIRWVRANAERYHLDADHIGALGGGSGGFLALMLGVTGDAPEAEGTVGAYLATSSRVSAVASLFGGNEGHVLGARPTSWVTDHDPPVLTVDDTALMPVSEDARLAAALRNVGVASFFIGVEGEGRGGIGTLADGRLEAFFARYLRGESAVVPTTPIRFGHAATSLE